MAHIENKYFEYVLVYSRVQDTKEHEEGQKQTIDPEF